MQTDLEIGKVFELDGVPYIPLPSDGTCDVCAFRSTEYDDVCNFLACMCNERKDGENVRFVKYNEALALALLL